MHTRLERVTNTLLPILQATGNLYSNTHLAANENQTRLATTHRYDKDTTSLRRDGSAEREHSFPNARLLRIVHGRHLDGWPLGARLEYPSNR